MGLKFLMCTLVTGTTSLIQCSFPFKLHFMTAQAFFFIFLFSSFLFYLIYYYYYYCFSFNSTYLNRIFQNNILLGCRIFTRCMAQFLRLLPQPDVRVKYVLFNFCALFFVFMLFTCTTRLGHPRALSHKVFLK